MEKQQELYKKFANLVLGSQLRDMTATSVKNCLASIYTMDASSKTFRHSKLSGILTLDLDRPLKTRFFRMYCMESFELLFECELYYGIEESYRQIGQNLWGFDFFEGIIAFQFINQDEAKDMAANVKTHSKKLKQFNNIIAQRKAQQQKKKKQGTFFGRLKNYFKGEDTKSHEETRVISVKKQNSITFDQSTGQFENIPPQFVQQLARLGISKKDLQDKDFAQTIMNDIVTFNVLKEAEADPSATALRQTIVNLNIVPLYDNMPPPPQLPPTRSGPVFPPSSMPKVQVPKGQIGRDALMQQIRDGGVKLKPVTTNDTKVTVDLSNMNKDDRHDLSKYLMSKIKQRGIRLRPNAQQE